MSGKITKNNVNSRAYHRHEIHAPIRLRIEGERNPFSAILNDYSKGGLRFETRFLLPQETVVHVTTPTTLPAGNLPVNSSDAQIIWHKQQIEIPEYPVFDLGCRWLSIDCDWCHAHVPFRQLHQSGDAVCLCLGCLEELENNLTGPLKENIHRFLLGNVI